MLSYPVFTDLPEYLAELNLITNDASQYLKQLSTVRLKKLGKFNSISYPAAISCFPFIREW